MRHVIDTLDLTVDELQSLMDTALDILARPGCYANACRGKTLATLFFEPSTRTRLSFESAMLGLGGSVISVAGASTSSAAKGESVADTAKVAGCLADIIAMRHPKEGAALAAAIAAPVPVINAGDGSHCHPTQTLADLLTVYREKGRLDHLTVGLCGDLKYGRTVHSLIGALSCYPGNRFVLISPEELCLPDYIRTGVIEKQGLAHAATSSLEDALGSLDILYMTRIQQERFDDPGDYERLKGSYILTPEKLQGAKADCAVLHPLPRVNEIDVRVDEDPRACYFRQVRNGKYMRMALILKLLADAAENPQNAARPEGIRGRRLCRNPRCITSCEQGIVPLAKIADDGAARCLYCEALLDE